MTEHVSILYMEADILGGVPEYVVFKDIACGWRTGYRGERTLRLVLTSGRSA